MTTSVRGEAPSWLNVSRETLAQLEAFVALVEKWQPAINLIAKRSVPVAWQRHVLDSAQLFRACPSGASRWADLGSGAGFPGIVIAIMAVEAQPQLRVTLVESDKRKATFLMQASRQLGLDIVLITERAESLAPLMADVVSARALASLSDLCPLALRHSKPGGIAVFPKGAQAEAELADTRRAWRFDATLLPSHTDPAGRIVIMKNIKHA